MQGFIATKMLIKYACMQRVWQCLNVTERCVQLFYMRLVWYHSVMCRLAGYITIHGGWLATHHAPPVSVPVGIAMYSMPYNYT